jgi:hypothetical protein
LSQFRMLWSVLAFTAEQNVGFLGQSRHSLIRSAYRLLTQSRNFARHADLPRPPPATSKSSVSMRCLRFR